MLTGRYFHAENLSGIDCSIILNHDELQIHFVEQGKISEEKWDLKELTYKVEDGLGIIYHTEIADAKLIISATEKEWKKLAKSIRGRNMLQTVHSKYNQSTTAKLTVIIVATLAFFAFAYFIGLSWVSGLLAASFPREYEIQMGEIYHKNVLENNTLDSAKTKNLRAFFKELGYESPYPIVLDVVVDKEVNAYAMPGGFMIINTGILQKMKTPEELAAVIAHELSHINQKHTTKSVFKSLSNYLFLSVLIGDASAIIGVVADHANELNNLSYSRSLEIEADNKGMELMQKKGIDIKGMLRLFETLKEEEKKMKMDNTIMKLLSTHPLTEDRIENAKKVSAQQKQIQSSPILLQHFNNIKNQ